MPMIDIYAPAGIFPEDADARLGADLTLAVLHAEGVATPGPFHLENTAAFIHRLPASAISTGSQAEAPVVRVQIITPPGALSRDGQRQIVREATAIIARVAGDESLAKRTWVILSEAAEGGWGLLGTAFGKEEFAALAAKAAAAKAASAS